MLCYDYVRASPIEAVYENIIMIVSALVLSRVYLLVCRDVTCCDNVRASPIEAVYVMMDGL